MKTIFFLHIKPFSLLLLFCIPLLAMECERDEKDDSNKPRSLRQHFSCKVNGELFEPKGQGTCYKWRTFYDPDGSLNTDSGYLAFSSRNCLDFITISMIIHPIFSTGIYEMNEDQDELIRGIFVDYNLSGSTETINHSSYNGKIHVVSFEPQSYENNQTQEGWIEGTFEMDCANEAGDTVHITEGKFGLILR